MGAFFNDYSGEISRIKAKQSMDLTETVSEASHDYSVVDLHRKCFIRLMAFVAVEFIHKRVDIKCYDILIFRIAPVCVYFLLFLNVMSFGYDVPFGIFKPHYGLIYSVGIMRCLAPLEVNKTSRRLSFLATRWADNGCCYLAI